MELLLVGYKFVAEGWFVTFEECWTSEDAEVGEGRLALEAVLIGSCWVAILVNNILGWAGIEDLNSIGMGMMEECTSKSCIVQEYVGSVVDFTPFGFANTIHFLMFRCCSFNFDTK